MRSISCTPFSAGPSTSTSRARGAPPTSPRCPPSPPATNHPQVPSTLMEYFAADPRVLSRVNRHYRTGEKLPEATVQMLCATKKVSPSLALPPAGVRRHGAAGAAVLQRGGPGLPLHRGSARGHRGLPAGGAPSHHHLTTPPPSPRCRSSSTPWRTRPPPPTT